MKLSILVATVCVFSASVFAGNVQGTTITGVYIAEGCLETAGKEVMIVKIPNNQAFGLVSTDNIAFKSIKELVLQAMATKTTQNWIEYENTKKTFWAKGFGGSCAGSLLSGISTFTLQ